MAWPKANIYPIPDEISAVELGKLEAGIDVGIFGCEPIGLLIIQLAKLADIEKIFATDKLEHRIEVAQKMGATEMFLSLGSEENAHILSATRSRGVDVTFEVAGEKDAVETAVETCKPGGRVMLCGIPTGNCTSFKASSARRKGLTIKIVRRMKHTYPRAIKLDRSGQVDVDSLVTHRFQLDEYEKAFETANNREGLKVIIMQ